MKFEGAWDELEERYCWQRQSLPKSMRETLVLVRDSSQEKKFNFKFRTVFRMY